jgi:uncharacterized membrane protein
MKHKTSILGLTLLLVLLVVTAALAEANTGYDIPWCTVDGGGGDSSSSGYSLSGTTGQADANGQLSGGDYSLRGGFWVGAGGGGVEYDIYLPLVLR